MNLNLFSQWQPGPWVEFCRKKTKFRNLVPIISVYFPLCLGARNIHSVHVLLETGVT